MRNQPLLASMIIDTLQSSGQFTEVTVTGSLSLGTYDDLSDIDILLRHRDRPPWENATLASQILADKCGVLLYDWAGSLIPDKYLITHFLPGYPLFWWIDLGCLPDAGYDDISRKDIPEDKNSHLAKLLVMNAKHYLRGNASRLHIQELHNKVYPGQYKRADEATLFKEVYAAIDYAGINQEFCQMTRQVLQQVANKRESRTETT